MILGPLFPKFMCLKFSQVFIGLSPEASRE